MILASVIQHHVLNIVGGYVLVLGSLALFTWRMLNRARRLASQLPDKDKPWT